MAAGSEEEDWIPGLRALLAYFELYRTYRYRLATGFTPHGERRAPRPGYEGAVDPDSIRASHRNQSHVERELLRTDPDERMDRFCKYLDRILNSIPQYQCELVRRRYLVPMPAKLPSDTVVHEKLRRMGLRGNYTQQKQEVLDLLIQILRLDRT